MTKVINIKHNPNWRPQGAIYIGRGSPFGNPFRIGRDGNRAVVIDKYKTAFDEKILYGGEFLLKVRDLKDKTLACYCRPEDGFQGQLLCHGQVIAGYLDEIEPEEVI